MSKDGMTLEEAIEELRGIPAISEVQAIRGQFKYEKAIQLGIEALERIKAMREYYGKPPLIGWKVEEEEELWKPLPSEEELITIGKSKYTEEELADLQHNACDDTIG